ncbi:class I SAM-dependent methyltransferase [Microlunatus speluncae]|uniref:class I SAM-dependent methyltransferase n=1 Tax=Microlunatus speluncae TaxID=2594267 RepID=UPI00126622D6|nr:class I SAM-dependent methyltransferase [Microlunatus speluncae]
MRSSSEEIAEAGYDEIAVPYQAWISSVGDDPRLGFLNDVLTRLPDQPVALDLGCGAGLPCTALLAEHGDTTGVDISAAQVELARHNVPKARFLKSSMRTLAFPAESFDLVTAFYSIPHLPRTDHAELFQRIAGWLRPGGILLATLGHKEIDEVADFFGAPMLTSSYGPKINSSLLRDAGLTVLTDQVLSWCEGYVTYQWVIAGKPG